MGCIGCEYRRRSRNVASGFICTHPHGCKHPTLEELKADKAKADKESNA